MAAPTTPGLNLIALHNVMYDGSQPQERFTGQVGTLCAKPNLVDVFVGNSTSGSFPMTLKSSLALAGMKAEGFGMSVPEKHAGLPQIQDDPNDPATCVLQVPDRRSTTVSAGGVAPLRRPATLTCSFCTTSTETALSAIPLR